MSDSASVDFGKLFGTKKAAEDYKRFENITSVPGRALLQQAGLIGSNSFSSVLALKPLEIFDNACGTGIVAFHLKEDPESKAKDAKILCGDVNEGMVNLTEKRAKERAWVGVDVKVVNAQDTKLPDAAYTHTVTNFCIMALPKPFDALKELIRITQPGGTIAFSTWNTLNWPTYFQKAVSRLPGCPSLFNMEDSWKRTGEWDSPKWVASKMKELGLEEVKSELSGAKHKLENLDEWLGAMDTMMGMMTKDWTEEEKELYKEKVVKGTREVIVEEFGEGKVFELSVIAVLTTAIKPRS